MKTPKSQRGSLLIIAVVMIVVVGFLSTVTAFLSVSQVDAGAETDRSAEALYLAESGLERGIRRWLQNPTTYSGEGPVALGGGNFTVSVSTTNDAGVALPANQRRIISLGKAASAARTTEAIVQLGGGDGFVEPFPNLNNWPTVGPDGDRFYVGCSLNGTNTRSPYTEGTVAVDFTENAPGSSGGAFRAEVTAGRRGEELGGYYERTLSTRFTRGDDITLDFWYKKVMGSPTPSNMMMAIDLVATNDTVYRVWSDCTANNIGWTAASVTWTVPNGRTIDRIRLSYDIQNRNGGGGGGRGRGRGRGGGGGRTAASAELFDQIVLTGPGGGGVTGVLSFQDPVP